MTVARIRSQVRIFTPHNRLAKVLTGIEGRSFDELVTASHDRLGQLEDAIHVYVAAQLAAVVDLYAQGEEAMFGRCRELGDLAMNIAEVAGAGKLPAMSEVARGLRAMTDSLVSHGVWHTEALGLHISCLTILARDDAPPNLEHQDAMLRDLKALRAAIGVME
jgi:hypothetical protein